MKRNPINLDTNMITIIISILTLIASIFFSEIQSKLGWLMVLISMIFIIISCLSVYKICIAPLQNKINRIYLDKINNSDLTILSEQQLAEYEQNEDLKELWIITYDLVFDTDNGIFKDIVSSNLEKGIKYVYFIPKNHLVESRKQQIKKHNNYNNNLEFITLDDAFFFFAPNLDCVLHFYKIEKANDGFIGLTMNNKRYYIKMSTELFHTTYGNLFGHINNIYEKR